MESKKRRLKRMPIAVRAVMLSLALLAAVPAARAINITLDYAYDTSNYFGGDHPLGAAAGAQAKAALEAAAAFLSGILNDTFSPIETPPPFHSTQFSGVITWNWSLNFTHPTTGMSQTVVNPTIAADEYRIYAGARNLGGTTLGRGGTGGYQLNPTSSGGFSPSENAQIAQIDANFVSAVQMRQETTGFAAWGGFVSFDRVGTTWHFDHTTTAPDETFDFYSVAIHELAHALGLGASAVWLGLVDDGDFTGLAAKAANGGVPPPLAPNSAHWEEGLMSQVYGTTTAQEAAMTPFITEGTRKLLTKLEAAALSDIGWDVALPSQNYNPADFDKDTLVDADDLEMWKLTLGANATADADGDGDSDGADFLIWQRQVGMPAMTPVPEPGALALAAIGAMAVIGARRRRLRQAASNGRI